MRDRYDCFFSKNVKKQKRKKKPQAREKERKRDSRRNKYTTRFIASYSVQKIVFTNIDRVCRLSNLLFQLCHQLNQLISTILLHGLKQQLIFFSIYSIVHKKPNDHYPKKLNVVLWKVLNVGFAKVKLLE